MNRILIRLAPCALLTLALIGCCAGECSSCKPDAASSPGESATATPAPCCCEGEAAVPAAPAGAAEENEPKAKADAGAWGTIKGQAVYAGGDAPGAKAVVVTKDPDHCLSKGPISSEAWVVNAKNKGVRWTYVWLAPEGDAKLPIHPDLKEPRSKTIELDQPCCKFEPHAIAMRSDQKWLVKNSAPVPHNVNWAGGVKNPGENKLLPSGGHHEFELVASSTPITVSCNIHGWMKAYVRVFDHPYFALTDENGNFEIKNAPAGTYRLIAWHEECGWLLGKRLNKENWIPIEIKAGGTTEVKVDVKPSE